MSVKLLTEHHLEFLSLKGGCTGSSESTLVKMSNCWNSHVAAHFYTITCCYSNVEYCHSFALAAGDNKDISRSSNAQK